MSGDERKIAERMLMTELKELEKENWVHAEVFPSQLSVESWLDREADEVHYRQETATFFCGM